jgi:hypothetical protein
MVVHDNDGGSIGDNGRAKDFAGMAKQGVQQTTGDEEMAENVAAGVQHQTNEGFHVGIVARVGGNVFAPIVGGVFGIFRLPISGRFPQCQHAKLAQFGHAVGNCF